MIRTIAKALIYALAGMAGLVGGRALCIGLAPLPTSSCAAWYAYAIDGCDEAQDRLGCRIWAAQRYRACMRSYESSVSVEPLKCVRGVE